MQAMGKNASSSQGLSSLAKALDQHKDDKVEGMLGKQKSSNNASAGDLGKLAGGFFKKNNG